MQYETMLENDDEDTPWSIDTVVKKLHAYILARPDREEMMATSSQP